MIGSVREIFNITTPEALSAALEQYDRELEELLKPLRSQLDRNVLSTDVTSIQTHMGYVESWRDRLVRHLSVVTGFVEHAKGSAILPPKATVVSEGENATKIIRMSEGERDGIRRKNAAGWVALQTLLEGEIDSIDSRVNLCKKMLGVEDNAPKNRRV